jgi:CelD/BcsL family acetyltransferase involved in cellulose biosynthesis
MGRIAGPRGLAAPCAMAKITLRRLQNLTELEPAWRDLENRSDGSMFQSWTWVGCLAAERFCDPVLLEAEESGRVVALALFNRRTAKLGHATLFLGESGQPAMDSVFAEYNDPLIETGREHVLAACLDATLGGALTAGGRAQKRRLVMSGVSDAVLGAAQALPAGCHLLTSRTTHLVDFARLPKDAELPAALGSATRYQLRRSHRRYAAQGPVSLQRAQTVAEALAWLEALAALHQATWTARGKPGAFANPFFERFHRELVARGVPRGEVDLLRIAAGSAPIGYLYNFRYRRRVCNYQGGFDYAGATSHQKPGLTCHHLAVEWYRTQDVASYDLLAGDDRYKVSLTQAQTRLHWLELTPRASLRHWRLFWAEAAQRYRGGAET